MAQPWYMYPSDQPGGGYGEILDPVCQGGRCSYLKPDTNIAVPSGTPITALLSGVVTDVSNKGAGGGGLSVTVKLDNALNSLAQYVSYNYLGSANVQVGQRLSAGQQLGIAGSPTGINFALALGSSPSWGGSGFQQNASGNSLLDPRPVLNAAVSGTLSKLNLGGIFSGSGTPASGSGACSEYDNCSLIDVGCHLSGAFCSLTHSSFFEQGVLVVIGLMLALVALVVIAVPELNKARKEVM